MAKEAPTRNWATRIPIIRGITNRKQTETALRESEERKRALLNAVPDTVIRIHRDGTVLDVQAPSEYRLLVPPSLFMGRNL